MTFSTSGTASGRTGSAGRRKRTKPVLWRPGGSRRRASRSRWTGGATSSGGCPAARLSCRRSGPDRTSIRCRRAEGSTARWAWLRGSRPLRRSDSRSGRWASWCSGTRRPVATAAAGARRTERCRGRTSSCTSSRDRCWQTPTLRSAWCLPSPGSFAARATSPAAYVLEVRDRAAEIDGAVATVGQIEISPGAANVIPASVRVTVDARAPDQERVDQLVAALGLEDAHYRIRRVAMSGQVRQILHEEVERAGAPVVELPSGAGHDAAPLGAAGVEAGMLFVRSLNGGASHSPQELSSPEDIEVALEVLTATLRRLSNPK